MIDSDEFAHEIFVHDHGEASNVGRWLWLLQNVANFGSLTQYGKFKISKTKPEPTIPPFLQKAAVNLRQPCSYVIHGIEIPLPGDCLGDGNERRRRRTSSAADDSAFGIKERDDLRSVHPDVHVRWRYAHHRIVVAIDIKASLGAVALRNPTTSGTAPKLALHDLLDGALRFISAIADSVAGSSISGGILLSVIAQGSQVADLRVFCHGALLCPSTVSALVLQLRSDMEPACVEMLSSHVDPPCRKEGDISHGVGTAGSDLCHLLVTSMAVLDMLPASACPEIIVATNGTVAAVSTERLHDAAACLRRSDACVGILLLAATAVKDENLENAASETYGHVPDQDILRRLAVACGGFFLPMSFLSKAKDAAEVADSFMCRDIRTRMGCPSAPPAELSGRPVHILCSTDYVPPVSGESAGGAGGIGAELRRALAARLREGFLLDAIGDGSASVSWPLGADLWLPLDCGLDLVAHLRVTAPHEGRTVGFSVASPYLRLSVGWRADDTLQRFLLAGTRGDNARPGAVPGGSTPTGSDARRGWAAGRASGALLRLRRFAEAVVSADGAHRLLAGPDGPAPAWALQGLPVAALEAAALVYGEQFRVELLRDVALEEILSVVGHTGDCAAPQSDDTPWSSHSRVLTNQVPTVGVDVVAGDDVAFQSLVGTLRAWPLAFRSDLIEVAVPDAGTVSGAEDFSATQAPAVTVSAASRSRWFAVVPPPALPRETTAIQACLIELSRRPTAALVIMHCIGAGGLDLSPDMTRDLVVGLDMHLRVSFPSCLGPGVRTQSEKISPASAGDDLPSRLWTVVDPGPGRRRRLLEWLSSDAFAFKYAERIVGLAGYATRQSTASGRAALNGSSRCAAAASLPAASLWPLLSLPPPRMAIKEWDACAGPSTASHGTAGHSWELNPGGIAACKVVFGQLLRDRHKLGFRVGHMIQRDPEVISVSLVCSVPVLECEGQKLPLGSLHIEKEARGDPGSADECQDSFGFSDRISNAMIQCRVELECRDKINFRSFVRVALFMEPISNAVVVFSLLPIELRRTVFMEEKNDLRKEMSPDHFFASMATALQRCDQEFGGRVAAYEEVYKHCSSNVTSCPASASDICCIEKLTSDHQPLVLALKSLPPERPLMFDSEDKQTELGTPPEGDLEGMARLSAESHSSANSRDVADKALREAFVERAPQDFGPEWRPNPRGIFNNWRCFSRLHNDSILLLLLPPHQVTSNDTCTKHTVLDPNDALWEWHSGITCGQQDPAISGNESGHILDDYTAAPIDVPYTIHQQEPSSSTLFQIHLYHVQRIPTSRDGNGRRGTGCEVSLVSSKFDGHGRGNACFPRSNQTRKVSSDTAADEIRPETDKAAPKLNSFERYFQRHRPCPSDKLLSPLDSAAAVAEKCYRRSYFTALLRLLAAGRRGCTHDLRPLLRWGSPQMCVNVAPKAALAHIGANPVLEAELQYRLEDVLGAHLRPAAGCPGHYIMVNQGISDIRMPASSEGIPGSIDGCERRSIPMLVRAGWSRWALSPVEKPTEGTRDSISETENPRAPRPRRRSRGGGWVLEVFFLDDMDSYDSENEYLNQAATERSQSSCDPFRKSRGKSSAPDGIRLWDSILGDAADSDSGDSDCADVGITFPRRAPPVYRHSLLELFRSARLAAGLFLLSRPTALAVSGLLGSSHNIQEHRVKNIPKILRTLRHAKPECKCGPIFVDIPLRFAPGIDLDVGLNELEAHLESRPTLQMRKIAEIDRSSGRSSRILLSHAWLNPGHLQDLMQQSSAEAERSPCWLLAEVRDGACRAAIYRTSDFGPTVEWVTKELVNACHDASRTLLLRAMHVTRRLDPLLAPSSPKPSNCLAGTIDSLKDDTTVQSMSVQESELSSSVNADSVVSLWACPKVYEICLQVHERLDQQTALELLTSQLLQPHALLDCRNMFIFGETGGGVFLLIPSMQSVSEGSPIVIKIYGIGKPSAELVVQFAGVLQGGIDDAVQKTLAKLLTRNREVLSFLDMTVP